MSQIHVKISFSKIELVIFPKMDPVSEILLWVKSTLIYPAVRQDIYLAFILVSPIIFILNSPIYFFYWFIPILTIYSLSIS